MTLKTRIQITEIIAPKSTIVKDLDILCGDIMEIKLPFNSNYFRLGNALYVNIINLTNKKTIRNFSLNTFARNNYFNYVEL